MPSLLERCSTALFVSSVVVDWDLFQHIFDGSLYIDPLVSRFLSLLLQTIYRYPNKIETCSGSKNVEFSQRHGRIVSIG